MLSQFLLKAFFAESCATTFMVVCAQGLVNLQLVDLIVNDGETVVTNLGKSRRQKSNV